MFEFDLISSVYVISNVDDNGIPEAHQPLFLIFAITLYPTLHVWTILEEIVPANEQGMFFFF